MKCPNCGSTNIQIQLINEIEEKKHGFLYKITIGWIIFLIKWIFFTLPALILKILGLDKKLKKRMTTNKYAVCQSCGTSIKIE